MEREKKERINKEREREKTEKERGIKVLKRSIQFSRQRESFVLV